MSKSTANHHSEVFDTYLASQPQQFQAYLTDLRGLIKSIVPQAEETFSYQAHCFKYIYMLVGIGSNKNFCSLYTMSPPLVKQMKDELSGCKISGATLHFKPDEQLPVELVTKIVLARMQENEALAASRNKKK